jgi:hypothetical protein
MLRHQSVLVTLVQLVDRLPLMCQHFSGHRISLVFRACSSDFKVRSPWPFGS